jgi:ribose transport system substrate-binding protein
MGGRSRWAPIISLIALLQLMLPGALVAQEATPAATPVDLQALPDPTAPETGPVQGDGAYRIVLLVPFPEDPFWQSVRSAVEARATADGATVDVRELSAPSVPEQLQQIDEAIAGDYDGILLGPVDAAGIAPGVAAANTAGIPVLAIDVGPTGGEVISVVQTDNVAATRLAGRFIGEELSGEGDVLNIQGSLAHPVAQARDQGLREGLADFPNIAIVSAEGSWQQGNAFGLTMAQLPQAEEGTPTPLQPLVDAVFAANPEMALGAAQAVEQVQADTVIVAGFGATTDTLKEIRSGTLEATIAEYPTRAGAIAVDLMVRHLNGESVPVQYDSGAALVTRENLDQYIASGA